MAGKIPHELVTFVKLRSDVEGVLQRIGRETYDLVVIDPEGNWTRAVFPSEDAVRDAAHYLEIRLHDGWDERLSQRMNRRDHWGEPGGQKRAI
jgi:hypothetical protein